MPKDNDSLINDILNEIENKSKATEKEDTATDELEKKETVEPENTYEPFESKPSENVDLNSAELFVNKALENSKKMYEEAEQQSRPYDRNADNSPRNDANRSANTKPIEKKKKKKKRKRNRLPGVLILTTLIFAVSISLSLVIIAYGKDLLGIGKSENTHLIIIEEGATTEDISLMLESEGIINSPKFFQLFSKISKADSEYIAGEHFVRPNMAYETIIQELTSLENEDKETVEVTFPEGMRLIDAANLLEEQGVCSADEFIFYFNSGGFGFEFENKLNLSSELKFYRMEGYLFPDTYFFYEDMEPEQVCQKIYLNFENKMTAERYLKMDELGLTLDQLITFASIVQKEAPSTESMTMVASVFWNRLNNPDVFPLLQSDPTRIYTEDVIRPNMEVYDQVMIDAYNTYVGAGLPPGAICNPGTEAIDAVLEAFQSDYFYFNANINTGQTYFSKTLEEHEASLAMVEQQYADAAALESGEDTADE